MNKYVDLTEVGRQMQRYAQDGKLPKEVRDEAAKAMSKIARYIQDEPVMDPRNIEVPDGLRSRIEGVEMLVLQNSVSPILVPPQAFGRSFTPSERDGLLQAINHPSLRPEHLQEMSDMLRDRMLRDRAKQNPGSPVAHMPGNNPIVPQFASPPLPPDWANMIRLDMTGKWPPLPAPIVYKHPGVSNFSFDPVQADPELDRRKALMRTLRMALAPYTLELPVPIGTLGLKVLQYFPQSARIGSPNNEQTWGRKIMVHAVCKDHDHEAPLIPGHPGDCGLYSFSKAVPAVEHFQQNYQRSNVEAIMCVIENFGRIAVHEQGYRSEYARLYGVVNMTMVDRTPVEQVVASAVQFGLPLIPFPVAFDMIEADQDREWPEGFVAPDPVAVRVTVKFKEEDDALEDSR